MDKIKILGTEYTIKLVLKKTSYWGKVDVQKKEIYLTNNKYEKNETIAHELLHAYLYQCGLDELVANETLHHSFGRFFEEFFENYKKIQKILPKFEK